jgi:4-amino-4-deoxy-L-arabinose transferase-like glycosyltransferase
MKWTLSAKDLFSEHWAPRTLFIVALIAHLAVFVTLLSHHGPYSFFLSDGSLNGNDTQNYVTIAKNIVEGNGYSRFPDPPFEPDGFRTPLLAFYFVPFVAFGGISFIWVAICLLNIALAFAPVILYRIARLFLSHPPSIVAGLFLTLEPLYLYRSQIAEPDAVLVLLFLWGIFFLVRGWKTLAASDYYIASAFLGVAILTKPTALYLAAIAFVFQALFLKLFGKGSAKNKILNWCIGVGIAVLVVFPWALRNNIVFGTWSISSVTGYNLYEYYTANIKMPNEHVPEHIGASSREPSRDLANQEYFTGVAMERIKHAPADYLREHAIGMIRNLFVSDISAIYHYGHTRILPFSYNPESRLSIQEILFNGSIGEVMRLLFSEEMVPKIVWVLFLGCMYALAILGWLQAWKHDSLTFLVFTMFLGFFAYLIVSSGPFVDAKYRLPALPLVALVALYGGYSCSNRLISCLSTMMGALPFKGK